MNPIALGICAVLSIILAWKLYRWICSAENGYSNSVYTTYSESEGMSETNRRAFYVLSDFDNSREAYQYLRKLNHNAVRFMRHLKKKYCGHCVDTDRPYSSSTFPAGVIADKTDKIHPKYPEDEDRFRRRVAVIEALLTGYNPEEFYENRPNGDTTSYTTQKGASMHLCLRDIKDPNKFIDYNTMMFVLLHEMSHIGNYDGWGHEAGFWETFRFILAEAVDFGIYDDVDYAQNEVNYCGLIVTHSPLHDETILFW